jgi:hypothetical protein
MPGQRQQFSAKVSGSSNNNVTWSISPRVGSITASGYYVAPSTLASSVTVKVIATSVADPTRSSAASVDLEAVSVAITPNSIALTDGKTQQFVADLTGTYNTAVKWSIVQGLGKISTSGLYTAPTGITVNSTVTVKAVSYADPTKFALATVYLTPNIPVSMSITPTFVSMKPGQTQQFNVTVYGPADKSITWSLSPPVGTISPTGLYTAPCVMTRTVVTITATSNANRTRSVSAVASVNAFIGVMVSPDPITIKAGQTLQLSALVNGLNSTSVNWTIPATAPGTISGTGLYVAPPAVAGPTVVTVSATSVVDPTKYGSATVTVIP